MKNKDCIKSVTVYSDRAYITREATFLPDDENFEYIFDYLPPTFIKDSVKVKGAGDFTLAHSDVYDYYDENTNAKEVKKLQDEIDELGRKADFISEKTAMYTGALNYLSSVSAQSEIDIVIKSDIDIIKPFDYSSLFNVVSKNKSEISDNILKLNIEKREILKSKKVLGEKLARLNGAVQKHMNACSVNCIDGKNREAVLRLSYLVTNASWRALYDARLLYKEKDLELLMYALINQQSGEDWENVELSVSTSKPVVSAYLAPHKTWFIDFLAPPPSPRRDVRRMAMKTKKAFNEGELGKECEEAKEDYDAFDEAPAPEPCASVGGSRRAEELISANNFSNAAISSSGIDAAFTASGGQDVPKDGSDKKVFVWLSKFPAEYEYIIMPSLEKAAYLKVKVKNNNTYPIVGGSVKVFRDYEFTGDSTLNTVLPGEDLELYLGIDQNIKVEHELINKFSEKKGLGGKDVKVEYFYRLTLESYKDSEEKLIISERVPISTEKDIEVKVTQMKKEL
jgi:uncharacterized protein (TIGR02231 family)